MTDADVDSVPTVQHPTFEAEDEMNPFPGLLPPMSDV